MAQISSPPSPEAGALLLTEDQDEILLGHYLDILEDPTGKLTIADITSPEYDSQFSPSQSAVPNYGFTDSAYWARLRLDNQTRQSVERWMELGFANMQYLDLYKPSLEGDGYTGTQTGMFRPVSSRDLRYPHFVFDLKIPAQSQQTYYLRFQNGASMTLPLTLWTPAAFFNHSTQEQIAFGIYYGILIGLLVYNLFLLYSIREASYLTFVLVLACFILEETAYDGYQAMFASQNLYILNKYLMPVSFPLLIASMVLFADTFLEVKTRLPKLHWVNLLILTIWGVLLLIIPFTRYHRLASLMLPWAMVSLLAIWITGLISWRHGFRPARFFMLAWFGMVASIFWVLLIRLGLVPSTYFSENLYRPGIVWMVLCWAIALADRINLLKAETENANRNLRSSEHRLSQILEGLPIGVVLYGKDRQPKYSNQRTVDLFSDPARGIKPDISAGRTLEQALPYYSLKVAGGEQAYPIEEFPIFNALQGRPASADDIAMERGDDILSLEIQASPVFDDGGAVESVVVAIQDVTERKQAEVELDHYRIQLESLVEERTGELNTVNEQLRLRLEWLSAVIQINQMIARSSDITQIYKRIIEIINQLFAVENSFIVEFDGSTKQYKILAHSCLCEFHPSLINTYIELPESIVAGSNFEQEKLVYILDKQLNSLSVPMGIHIEVSKVLGIALVPLQLREKVFGFLGLEMHEGGKVITSEETNLLGIFSIDIAQLIEDSQFIEQSKALITVEERNRLARDLHDSVTQVLFSITLLAEVLPQIWLRDPEQGLARLDKLQHLTRGALAEMRTMLLELRPSAVINIPLSDLLAQLTEATASRSGLAFQLFIEQVPALPETVQINIYRIAQETLNNIVKHSQASQVTLSLSVKPFPADPEGGSRSEIRLVIQDNGVGFYAEKRRSDQMGIGIMHERAAAIEASLSIESQPGHGTQVTLIWCCERGVYYD